jgi:epoxyqueuosine reductase QueG
MKEKHFQGEIRDFLRTRSLPLVGIARASQLPQVPDDLSPQRILAAARSIICFGVPIPKGVVHAEAHALLVYWRYCNAEYRSLDTTANQLSLLLEERGHSAGPIYSCFPWKAMDRKFWGLSPLVYWADQAGVGRLTRSGLLATPDHGTRVLLGGVVTTADLEPTARRDEDLCPPGCRDCMDGCPAQAIDRTGSVDHNLCIRRSGANPLLAHLLSDPSTKEKFPFETILNTVAVDDHGSYTCFECVRLCPLNK